jgi:spore maturation protein CgeB
MSESTLWKRNLFDSLVDLGHQVIPFSQDVTWHFSKYLNFTTSPEEQALFLAYKAKLQTALVEEIRREHQRKPIDLFFSYFWSDICEPETIEEIKRLGITTVNWYCNASYQFHLVERLAPAYDYCLVPEKFRLDDYRRAGATPLYCQEAANPQVYRPFKLPVTYDVVFIGQRYGNRPLYVDQLGAAGVNVWAFGPGWQIQAAAKTHTRPLWQRTARRVKRLISDKRPVRPHANYGPPLSDDEYLQMYSRSKISLGFTTTGHQAQAGEPPIKQVRLRDFEATMSGAFYMVEHFEELAEFFEPDKEIIFFHNPEDLIEKARYYLAHDAERERIRQTGLRRALAEHTWQKRFETAFREMGLD